MDESGVFSQSASSDHEPDEHILFRVGADYYVLPVPSRIRALEQSAAGLIPLLCSWTHFSPLIRVFEPSKSLRLKKVVFIVWAGRTPM